MVEINASSGLVLFVDVAGSTQLYEALGDVAAYIKISTCLAQLGDIVARYGGVVVKHIGDEVMCFFSDPVAGMRAAVVAQIETHTASENAGLPVRIGCHAGPILVRNGDLFGDTVNIAAHLASLAKASQILTSKETIGLYEASRHQHVRSYEIHQFLDFEQPLQDRFLTEFSPKGKQYQVRVYVVMWEIFLDDMIADWTYVQPLPEDEGAQVLIIEGLGLTHVVRDKALLVGRVDGMGVQVNNRNVSRQHGIFEPVAGQVQYTDQSSNGTYLKLNNGTIQFLHRSTAIISSEGVMSFGIPFEDPASAEALFKISYREDPL